MSFYLPKHCNALFVSRSVGTLLQVYCFSVLDMLCSVTQYSELHQTETGNALLGESSHACLTQRALLLPSQHTSFQNSHQALFLSTHQSLAVLILLLIFFSDSSVLKDTLVLIERQSHTLETHSEYLFSSILSAMDCLTDPGSEEASGK